MLMIISSLVCCGLVVIVGNLGETYASVICREPNASCTPQTPLRTGVAGSPIGMGEAEATHLACDRAWKLGEAIRSTEKLVTTD
jgi:hypothetical protein